MILESKTLHIVAIVWVNLCRLLLAGVFIFSGFVKANDPLGFMYKLSDYAHAFRLSEYISDNMLLLLGVFISILEFLLGVYLLFGIHRRIVPFVSFIMMLIMTPLTLYLALKNPVSDCGCFGDAVVLSNWETFIKNAILLVASISVWWGRELISRWITPRGEWLVSWNAALYICCFAYYCFLYLPVFDFRPYRIGTNIRESMQLPEEDEDSAFETFFIMEREGVRREFAAEEYPEDSTWSLVDTRLVVKGEDKRAVIQDFSMTLSDTEEDLTELVVQDTGYVFLLVAYQLESADDGYADLVNDLYDYCLEYGYPFYALTASGNSQIELWCDKTGAEYPFCHVDDITLKTMVRSNPGLILLKNGVVANKWSCRAIPDDFELTEPLQNIDLGEVQSYSVIRKITISVLWFVGSLILIFLLDHIGRLWTRFHNKAREKGEEGGL